MSANRASLNIPKLEDANNAGKVSSKKCTLILTEGDSAKALAVAGLGVIGRAHYGVFPLKGKILNVRQAPHDQIVNNKEISDVIKILGLKHGEVYDTTAARRSLRYGKVIIMADQVEPLSRVHHSSATQQQAKPLLSFCDFFLFFSSGSRREPHQRALHECDSLFLALASQGQQFPGSIFHCHCESLQGQDEQEIFLCA